MIEIAFANSTLRIDEQSGTITDWHMGERSLLRHASPLPLFILHFRANTGEPLQVTARDAATCEVDCTDEGGETYLVLRFARLAGLPIHAVIHMRTTYEQQLTHWRLVLTYEEEKTLEWVKFPGIVVPNDLVAAEGDARLLWPALEGTLIEDAHLRERTWMRYEPETYPSKSWDGTYPAANSAQMMAYCTSTGGLYLAAHDPNHTPKRIEYLVDDDRAGIQLDFQVFPGASTPGTWEMAYEMVLGVFQGDWYDAASIYRRWWEKTPQVQVVRPSWLRSREEPLVVIFPVRGTHDVGEMAPNEYYPYERALPTIERLAQRLDTRVLALLMHWEGTAPWAPPYVWPPFGGVEPFARFATQLHERGHLLGVYASGIGWTQESLLVAYDRSEQFTREGLHAVMCLSPSGELPFSLNCAGQQRWGYDMCPGVPFVTGVVTHEIAQLAANGCDYAQFFDQQPGGAPANCYSHEHGHPPVPGPWQVAAMRQVYKAAIEAAGETMVLGCEGAAAPPYFSSLPMNDARANMAFWVGHPVPLHAFLYHKHTSNFMGNQVYIHAALDCAASPENFSIRLAYAFLAGDRLAITLGSGGTIQWGWCAPWEMTPPEQEPSAHFIRTLLTWRKCNAQAFLMEGRMEKPYPVATGLHNLLRMDGSRIPWPAVMTSRWSLPDGRQAQLFVNPLGAPQWMTVHLPPDVIAHARLATEPRAEPRPIAHHTDGKLALTLEPLSIALVTW